MKLLIISHSADLMHSGGAESAAAAHAIAMREKGHDVTHIACHPNLDSDFGYDEISNTHLINSQTFDSSYLWKDHRTQMLWTDLLENVRPDIVHLHHYLNCGILLPALVKRVLPKCKVFLTLHEYLAICGLSGQMLDSEGSLCSESGIRKCSKCMETTTEAVALNQSLIKLSFKFVDAFISPSKFLLNRYSEWGLARDDIHLIENFIRVTNNDTVVSFEDKSRSPYVMNFMSQHTPSKGLDVLLLAILDLKDRYPNYLQMAKFDIWGSGSERWPEDFHPRIKKLRKKTVDIATFKGPYRAENLSAIYTNAAYTIVPSIWWENSPLVIQESHAHGVPVIGSNLGGISEKLSVPNGDLVFKVGDFRSLADTIVQAISNPSKRPRLNVIHSNQNVYELHMQIYKQLR